MSHDTPNARPPLGHAALRQRGLDASAAGRHAEAVHFFRKAVELAPRHAGSHNNLGLALRALGQDSAAEQAFRAALLIEGNHPRAHYNLGLVLSATDRKAEAMLHFRAALDADKGHTRAWFQLGHTLIELGRNPEAEAALREAILRDEKFADAIDRLGNVLMELNRLDEAEAAHRRALKLKPATPGYYVNLAVVCRRAGKIVEARDYLRRALAADPGMIAGNFNDAILRLLTGDWVEGWRKFEWRWKLAPEARPVYAAPNWLGEDLAGKTIVLGHEQGLGDSLQFVRYASLVAARGGRVFLDVPAPLKRLLSGVEGVSGAYDDMPPNAGPDYHCLMVSLPERFATTVDTAPAGLPYLHADAADVARWRQRIEGDGVGDALRVGLTWHGASRSDHESPMWQQLDTRRSIPLEAFGDLADLPNVAFYSLQKREPAEPAQTPPPGLLLIDHSALFSDFSETAALVMNLDLVISVDTSVAHLAGGLGKPVWLLNRFDTCWRWLLERDDSPWYPSLRQFRQSTPGDWAGVLGRVRTALLSYRA